MLDLHSGISHRRSTLALALLCALGVQPATVFAARSLPNVSPPTTGETIIPFNYNGNADALLTHYYNTILDRVPDAAGFAEWQKYIAAQQAQGVSDEQIFRNIAASFFDSAEYQAKNLADAAYVDDLYEALFQRAGDPGGVAYWNGVLASGTSRDAVLGGFLYAPEFTYFMQEEPTGPVYQAIGDFQHGLALVEKDGQWGAIDPTGTLQIPTIYERLKLLPHGYVAFRNEQHRWGVLNANHEVVVEPSYDQLGSYTDGIVGVANTHSGTWRYIDTATGEPITVEGYRMARPFAEDLAAVQKNDKQWVYLDRSGREALTLDPEVYRAYSFSPEGLALVRYTGPQGEYGYINRSGQPAFDQQFVLATDFSEGLAAVSNGAFWGYINAQGEQVIPFIYASAAPFHEGLASVEQNDQRFYIDHSGKKAIAATFNQAGSFSSDGIARVQRGQQAWYINRAGESLGIAKAQIASGPMRSLLAADSVMPQSDTSSYKYSLGLPYNAGLVMFRLSNYTDKNWSVGLANAIDQGSSTAGYKLKANFVPGVPTTLKAAEIAAQTDNQGTFTSGNYSFIAQYLSGYRYHESQSSFSKDLFRLTLDDGSNTTLTLLTNVNFSKTVTPTGDGVYKTFLSNADSILEGLFDFGLAAVDFSEGRAGAGVKKAGTGMYYLGGGIYHLIKGLNDSTTTGSTQFVAILSGTSNSAMMKSESGYITGQNGDTYLISTGQNGRYLVEMNAVRPSTGIPEVHLQIHPYSQYYAYHSLVEFQDFREHATSMSTVNSAQATMLKKVFANYLDVNDSDTCISADGKDSYMADATLLSDLSSFWYFADHFNNVSTSADLKGYDAQFKASCP